MFYDKDDDSGFWWLFVAMPLALIGAFTFRLLYPPKQPPPPKKEVVFGCYTTETGPPILIDSAGVHIMQPGLPTVPFDLVKYKTGYAVTLDQSITFRRTRTGLAYSIGRSAGGTNWNFFHEVDGQRYGVIDEIGLNAFTTLGHDWTIASYFRSSDAACSTRAS
ncbi:MAG: hypothetical protein EBR34_15355 [Sphingomonadaceae bacterium]|nr:hypothetical protein [Sphingomonadaceae bacterium]